MFIFGGEFSVHTDFMRAIVAKNRHSGNMHRVGGMFNIDKTTMPLTMVF